MQQPLPDRPATVQPRVYLAGPMVFYPDPAATFALMQQICHRHALEGVSPLDNQLELTGLPPGRPLLQRIVAADIELMRSLDGGIFCLDGFRRSPEMDPGTAFEIGYMHALGKPLVGWTADPRGYRERVADYFYGVFELPLLPTPGIALGATSGEWRDPDGVLVHSDGCHQNAMTEIAIERSGGEVFADPDWARAFEAAARHLATALRRRG